MATAKDVARANKEDAFMRLMRSGPLSAPLHQRRRLYEAYECDGWPSVHDELVHVLRAAERERNAEEDEDRPLADLLAQALGEVFRYQVKGYGLGRCTYVPADLPHGAKSGEIEEYERRSIFPSREVAVLDARTARLFGHYFLSASARRIPKWCPDHSLAARQRNDRQKKLKARHSGKFF